MDIAVCAMDLSLTDMLKGLTGPYLLTGDEGTTVGAASSGHSSMRSTVAERPLLSPRNVAVAPTIGRIRLSP